MSEAPTTMDKVKWYVVSLAIIRGYALELPLTQHSKYGTVASQVNKSYSVFEAY